MNVFGLMDDRSERNRSKIDLVATKFNAEIDVDVKTFRSHRQCDMDQKTEDNSGSSA